jgi:GntR family transcriptional regulator, transcriptional repressor for pyruvate dehydrogenase complex
VFTQAKKNRVFQSIIDQIEHAILYGELSEGDRLPPERELTELFGASRGTIREALRVVEEKGLIEVKTGMAGGAVVQIVPPRKVTEGLGRLIRSQQVSMHDIAEFREGVEGLAAALAAEKSGPAEIGTLTEVLRRAEAALAGGVAQWDRFIDADNEFHRFLGEFTGNTLYELVLNSVHENISRYYDRLLDRTEELMRENYRDLEDVLRAIVEKRPDDAAEKIRGHVRRFSLYMREQKEE